MKGSMDFPYNVYVHVMYVYMYRMWSCKLGSNSYNMLIKYVE